MSRDTQPERGLGERAYEPPTDPSVPMKVGNPVHTGIFGALFVALVLGLPLFVGGLAGIILAVVLSSALWGAYSFTLPKGPKVADIGETAGATTCPACDSVQTDRRPAADPGEPTWECFNCDHRWTPG